MLLAVTLLAAASLLLAIGPFFPPQQLTALVPLNPGSLSGANGTVWTTTLWATNSGDDDVSVACSIDPHLPQGPCPLLKAHSTTALAGTQYDVTHEGFFLGVPVGFLSSPAVPDTISFSLRVTDSVTAPHSSGAEIPLPRRSDFRNAPLVLAHVPAPVSSRSRVRLYGLANGVVKVRIVGIQSNQELFSTQVALSGVDTKPDPFMRFPSYGELALPSTYAGSDEAVRVEITPSGTLALWGFASVTDDNSEQFTIVSPSRLELLTS
jgi:hypothetical protein